MRLLAKTQPFHGVRFHGKTYDCGSRLGFLTANVAFAVANPEISTEFREMLKQLVGKL